MAEEAVKAYLERLGKTVRDVRRVREYMLRDIDYVATVGKSAEYVEVKCDTWLHKTGNLFLEITRDHGGPGVFYRSKADWWYYVDGETGDCLIIPLAEAQAWVMRNFQQLEPTTTRSHRGGQFVEFFGFKCPADLLVQALGVQRVTLPLG